MCQNTEKMAWALSPEKVTQHVPCYNGLCLPPVLGKALSRKSEEIGIYDLPNETLYGLYGLYV
jgi:hypothetical protein